MTRLSLCRRSGVSILTRLAITGGALATISFSQLILAVPLAGQYSVTTTVTPIDSDSYVFTYSVFNVNQQIGLTRTGFDGFYIQIPKSGSISNISVPPPFYGFPGHWEYLGVESPYWLNVPEAPDIPRTEWIRFWGYEWASVYPINSTATISFQADGVTVGTTNAITVSFWALQNPPEPYVVPPSGGRYTGFSTALLGPIAVVPESSTALLLGIGIAAFAASGAVGAATRRAA